MRLPRKLSPITPNVHFSSATGDWETPPEFFDRLQGEFPFVLDVCATAKNAKCTDYFSPRDNAFLKRWHKVVPADGWAWMNSPYGDPEYPCKPNCIKKKCIKRGHHNRKYIPGISDWIRRAYVEATKGLNIVCLLPARTDTKWFHDWVFGKCDELRFIKGRLKFGNSNNSAPFPSMLAIYCDPLAIKSGAGETCYTSMLANLPPRVYPRIYAMPRRLRIRPRGTYHDHQESGE